MPSEGVLLQSLTTRDLIPLLRTWVMRSAHYYRRLFLFALALFILQFAVIYFLCLALVVLMQAFIRADSLVEVIFRLGVVFCSPFEAISFDSVLYAFVILLFLQVLPFLRLRARGWVESNAGTTDSGQFSRDNVYIRRVNYANGFAFCALLGAVKRLFFCLSGRAVRVVRLWLEWQQAQPVVPIGAAAIIKQILALHEKDTWNPVTKVPGVLPMLEDLLALRVLRLRENVNYGVELRLETKFVRFLSTQVEKKR